MSEEGKIMTEQEKAAQEAAEAAKAQADEAAKAAKASKPTNKKINATVKQGDTESVNLRELNRKANEDGSFKGTPPTKQEQEAVAASKKYKLGAPVMVRTASGSEMYDPRSATWIDGRVSKVPMSNWLEAQIKAGKIIKE